MRSLAEARIKRARAVELVADGMSYDEVAKEVGYSHRGSAHRAVFKALTEREIENVAQLRWLEEQRLDAMLAALWPRIEAGDVDAILAALQISDRRIRLLGLVPKARGEKELISMVVDVPEGNAREATLDQVRAWSEAARSR